MLNIKGVGIISCAEGNFSISIGPCTADNNELLYLKRYGGITTYCPIHLECQHKRLFLISLASLDAAIEVSVIYTL
jgi:hypothetical protein